jgi:hypothetical protein
MQPDQLFQTNVWEFFHLELCGAVATKFLFYV